MNKQGLAALIASVFALSSAESPQATDPIKPSNYKSDIVRNNLFLRGNDGGRIRPSGVSNNVYMVVPMTILEPDWNNNFYRPKIDSSLNIQLDSKDYESPATPKKLYSF